MPIDLDEVPLGTHQVRFTEAARPGTVQIDDGTKSLPDEVQLCFRLDRDFWAAETEASK
jgi:hypothetical protein